jgi:ACS family D-galactonate transporter-like MFS transporter
MLFISAGVAGLLFALLWWWLYRDPAQSQRINQAEMDYITAGGAVAAPAAPVAFSWANIYFLFKQRQVLGASIGQFTSNSTLVFFLTWFPTYLATERHMGWIKVGFFSVMPYIAAAIGVLAGGALSDLLLKRSGSANVARKLPIVSGLLLASTIVTANFVDDDVLVIGVMSVAFFGQGMCNLGWTLISDVAPRELIGLTGGLFNLCANVAGVVTPLVIGLIVSYTGSFYWALAYIATLAALGVLSYVFVVGDVKRVVWQAAP